MITLRNLEKTEHVHPVKAAKTRSSGGGDCRQKGLKKRTISVQFGPKRQKNGANPFTFEAGRAKGCESAPKTEHVRSPAKTITS